MTELIDTETREEQQRRVLEAVVDDPEEVTHDELRAMIQDAMEEAREQALEDFTDYLKSAESPE